MDFFSYINHQYCAEQVALDDIASAVGTPCYVYSRATLERHYRVFEEAFGDYPHKICYAVKANSTLAILQLLKNAGAGFDIVSGGELERVLAVGCDPADVVFSGVGKSQAEIRRALEVGVRCLNVESAQELNRIGEITGETGHRARIAVRINPDVDARTHPYIATGLKENKFGIPVDEALDVYRRASTMDGVSVSGVACHIGSQLTSLSPFGEAVDRVLDFCQRLQDLGIEIDHVDMGGGLGVRYQEETPPSPAEYLSIILERFSRRDFQLPVTIEPGRAIVGNAGVLLTRVEYVKPGHDRQFVVVDAAMNDLLRPALYQSWQEVVPVSREAGGEPFDCDVVGPVCESADFLARGRQLYAAPGDLVAIRTAGAYGSVMASNYNSRPRPAEVMVDGNSYAVIRPRESYQQMFGSESIPEFVVENARDTI